MEIGAVHKNTDGSLGPKCGRCGGYGFTNLITGGSAGCNYCDQTGVEPIKTRDLQKQIDELKQIVTSRK